MKLLQGGNLRYESLRDRQVGRRAQNFFVVEQDLAASHAPVLECARVSVQVQVQVLALMLDS